MQNQMKANGLRIDVLQRENAKLHKSLSKLLGANYNNHGSSGEVMADRHGSAPVQLWNYNASNNS